MANEEGQALVLGAVVLVALAFTVMVTLQLGHAIEERVRVQTSADNTAWSTGVVVARSLNFIAFANRTMVAHYVAMMAFQSLASSLTALEASLGISSDVLQTLASSLCGRASSDALLTAAARLRRESEDAGRALDAIDRQAADAVLQLAKLNLHAVFEAQKAMRNLTAAALDRTGNAKLLDTILATTCGACNEENPTGTGYRAAMADLNGSARYRSLFDDDGAASIPRGGSWYGGLRGPGDDPQGIKPAERLMTELANATRTGPSQVTFESKRALRLPKISSRAAPLTAGATMLVDPMSPSLFSESRAVGRNDRNYVFMNYWKHSQFSRGSALAAAEYVGADPAKQRKEPQRSQVVGIQATAQREDSFHCRYAGRDLISTGSCAPVAVTRPLRCEPENFRHRFLGITPYLSFEATADAAKDFGQPSLYAFVNKSPERARIQADLAFGFDRTGKLWSDAFGGKLQVEGNNRPGLSSLHGRGLNGWARAQVYYHRPGAWAEPPNLFNPYWKARLAPLALKPAEIQRALPLSATDVGHALVH